ncbi:uracil-xanthine permease family protein [Anaerococcus porci]|uniref:Purine permease n=1 Tax=Anaerococcus porci TaxID=2652269 RepID=A0A6N7VWI9_9FIRM|nr:solute carrier family 23 protein [Anaerococcus porci]MDY3007180.1 solute carrier family 23 protein [Anaerococcus porci]MSS78413.1 purine permease [Anaerococcus porci]
MTEQIKDINEEKIEEKIPTTKAIILAIEHSLVMNAYVVPLILASILAFNDQQKIRLIQSSFLASGITTILQAVLFMKYPLVYGPSFVPVGGIIGIYMINGGNYNSWSYVVGACLVGAIIQILLGLSKQFNRILQSLISPVVGACVVFSIGLSLIPLALKSNIFIENEASMGENIIIAIITMVFMIIFSLLGEKNNKIGSVLRVGSAMLALFCGLLTYISFGYHNFDAIKTASIISRPSLPFVDFSIKFDPSSILTMIILYFVIMTETVGSWLATSSTTNTSLSEKRVNNGILGLGISNFISSLLGVSPMTGYSSNVGVLALSKIFSRHVMKFVGAILILVGLSGKLAALITVIPTAAIGGIFLITSGIIALAGIGMLKNIEFTNKNTYIIILSLVTSLALNLMPEEIIKSLPTIVQYILGSSIASSSLLAIILNKIIPDNL